MPWRSGVGSCASCSLSPANPKANSAMASPSGIPQLGDLAPGMHVVALVARAGQRGVRPGPVRQQPLLRRRGVPARARRPHRHLRRAGAGHRTAGSGRRTVRPAPHGHPPSRPGGRRLRRAAEQPGVRLAGGARGEPAGAVRRHRRRQRRRRLRRDGADRLHVEPDQPRVHRDAVRPVQLAVHPARQAARRWLGLCGRGDRLPEHARVASGGHRPGPHPVGAGCGHRARSARTRRSLGARRGAARRRCRPPGRR